MIYKSHHSLLLLIFLLTSSLSVFAAEDSGIIKGRILDKKTQDPIIGATVKLANTTSGTISNLDGEYTLNLEDGIYTIIISSVSYEPVVLENIKVERGKTVALDVLLESSTVELEAANIIATRRRSSEISMISAMKANLSVSSGISSQQISRTQDRNAAEVIQRIPGISITDNRFIIVRGLSQRYNNVFLNDAPTPSSEADIRAFSFDVLPGAQIENIIIKKSPMAELPADFSGGFVEITTKNMPDSNSFSISYSNSVLAGTSFNSRYTYEGSPTDWLGFDNGTRKLPGDFPVNINKTTPDEQAFFTDRLNDNWKLQQHGTMPDQRLSASLAHRFDTKKTKIGNFTALNYSNTFKSYDMFNARYGIYDAVHEASTFNKRFQDTVYNNDVKLSILFNWAFLFGDGSKVAFCNFFNQSGRDRTTVREGNNYSNDYYQKEKELFFSERTTYSGQLKGTHSFREQKDKLHWNIGYSLANKQEPDRKIIVSLLNENPLSPFFGQYGTSGNDIKRNFQKLNEHIVSVSADYEALLETPCFSAVINAGVYGEYKNRSFQARNFVYDYGDNMLGGVEYAYLPYYEIVSAPYIHAGGTVLDEKTNKSDSYDAVNILPAAHLSAKMTFWKFNAYVGLRIEHNRLMLDSYESDGIKQVNIDEAKTDLFPSANLIFNINKKHLLRFTYGRTINRPEFREIAPYVYYDFDLFANFEGNPALGNAYVQNMDLRYEWYPDAGEVLSLGVFYKSFINPIEITYFYTGGQLQYSFTNAESARNLGMEIEIRKNLGFMGMKNFSLVGNLALIKSEIHFGEDRVEADRAMQGQSPYVGNVALFYQNDRIGLNINLQYNIVGKRIVVLGEANQDPSQYIPDTYEMPRNVVDLSFSQRIGKHWEIRGGIKDIFNEAVEFKQFPSFIKNGKKETREQTTRLFYPGQLFTLGVGFKF